MRVLLDTNALFDITARQSEYPESAMLLVPNFFGDVELWVSAKSYTDIFYVLCKNMESGAIQDAFLSGLDHLQVCSVDKDVVKEAASRKWEDFEDCIMAVCAERIGADFIATRDEKGFAQARVPAISPEELLGILSEDGLHYERLSLD